MRKISRKERKKAGHIYCPYCKPKRVDAVWRIDGSADRSRDVACEKHKDKITEVKERDYFTEADYQTWIRRN